jgi:Putative zinc-finger
MRPEPQLEELSAYLDHELTGAQRQELESHLAGCETCRRRLESLGQTVRAIAQLPKEVPPRAFVIPSQRAQGRRFTPAGWAAGLAAAAVLALIVAINLPHAGGAPSGGGATGGTAAQNQQYGPASKGTTGVPNQEDRAAHALAALPNRAIVSDPAHPTYRLTLAANATRLNTGGTLGFEAVLEGVQSTGAGNSSLQVILVKGGAGVALPTIPRPSGQGGAAVYGGQVKPPAGSYRLIATWTLPDGSGTVLMAEVPVEVVSG